ncbi:myb-like protein X [Biomphalaria glabrata]|uniref:Myb-like protein X n=1 Tax=Biomphalaria glabrata TaxID=6526 RepID=A0A9W2ZQ81_BIOGL|nr:myb-like protein X [Biomphalaria glabrata]
MALVSYLWKEYIKLVAAFHIPQERMEEWCTQQINYDIQKRTAEERRRREDKEVEERRRREDKEVEERRRREDKEVEERRRREDKEVEERRRREDKEVEERRRREDKEVEERRRREDKEKKEGVEKTKRQKKEKGLEKKKEDKKTKRQKKEKGLEKTKEDKKTKRPKRRNAKKKKKKKKENLKKEKKKKKENLKKEKKKKKENLKKYKKKKKENLKKEKKKKKENLKKYKKKKKENLKKEEEEERNETEEKETNITEGPYIVYEYNKNTTELQLFNNEEFKADQKKDTTLTRMYKKAQTNEKQPGLNVPYFKEGILVKKSVNYDTYEFVEQIILPLKYTQDIIEKNHNFLHTKLASVTRTKKRILDKFYWPSITKDVKKHVSQCQVCQMNNSKRKQVHEQNMKVEQSYEQGGNIIPDKNDSNVDESNQFTCTFKTENRLTLMDNFCNNSDMTQQQSYISTSKESQSNIDSNIFVSNESLSKSKQNNSETKTFQQDFDTNITVIQPCEKTKEAKVNIENERALNEYRKFRNFKQK